MADDNKNNEGPSLAELIETRRFLGREFLTWVWFESEIFEQRFSIEGFGECELHLEKQLNLESPPDRDKETSKLTGIAPSGTPEAREALRQGKLPTRAKLVVRRDEQEFALVLDADGLALSAVKIPALIKGEGEDPFYERIQLIEEIEGAFERLYRDFLLLRLRDVWGGEVIPAIAEWMHEEDGPALAAYRQSRQRYGVPLAVEAEGRRSVTVSRVKTKKPKPAA